MLKHIEIDHAIALLSSLIPQPETETIPISQALGRILATDIHAKVDHPSLDDSAMDGIACRISDVPQIPHTLKLVGESKAGSRYTQPLNSGEAVRIYTGAPVPEGADAIAKVENLHFEGNTVTVLQTPNPKDIRHQGSDFKIADLGLKQGTRLNPAAVALCAAMGHSHIVVQQKLKVGVLSTGDEVVEVGNPLSAGQVYDSNRYGLKALLEASGCKCVLLEHSPDDVNMLKERIQQQNLDVLLTSGGVSMGNYDIVRDMLTEEGEVLFWKVNLRPGGPVMAGRWQGLPVVGLPGNPVSALVVFMVLVQPALCLALGTPPLKYAIKAKARDVFKSVQGKTAFWRGVLNYPNGYPEVENLNSPMSNMLLGLARANCLVRVEPHESITPDSEVWVLPLD